MSRSSSLWHRLRIRWHAWLRGLTREAADDLVAGVDLGDSQVRMPAPGPSGRPLRLGRRALSGDERARLARLGRAERRGVLVARREDMESLEGGREA